MATCDSRKETGILEEQRGAALHHRDECTAVEKKLYQVWILP